MSDTNLYLKLKFRNLGVVAGPAPGPAHKGEIPIRKFSHDVQNRGGGQAGSAANGKGTASVSDIHLELLSTAAANIIFNGCVTQDIVDEAVITFRTTDASNAFDSCVITVTDGLVTSFQSSASASGETTDLSNFTLRFRTIKIERRDIVNGQVGKATIVSYDTAAATTNSQIDKFKLKSEEASGSNEKIKSPRPDNLMGQNQRGR